MPDLRLTLRAKALEFDPFADKPASFTNGFRGYFPGKPGTSQTRVDMRIEPLGVMIRLGEARPRSYFIDLRELVRAAVDAETPDYSEALHV